MSDLTPEERCERVRMALAEAGYHGIGRVYWGPSGTVRFRRPWGSVPMGVVWRAFTVADPAETACWPCWRDKPDRSRSADCPHNALTSEWPPLSPPMESREA